MEKISNWTRIITKGSLFTFAFDKVQAESCGFNEEDFLRSLRGTLNYYGVPIDLIFVDRNQTKMFLEHSIMIICWAPKLLMLDALESLPSIPYGYKKSFSIIWSNEGANKVINYDPNIGFYKGSEYNLPDEGHIANESSDFFSLLGLCDRILRIDIPTRQKNNAPMLKDLMQWIVDNGVVCSLGPQYSDDSGNIVYNLFCWGDLDILKMKSELESSGPSNKETFLWNWMNISWEGEPVLNYSRNTIKLKWDPETGRFIYREV